MLEKNADAKITEEEARLYDRQIRLWGLDSQKRLRSSHVLVSGMRGLGCEVAKNLVLAGVRSLTVMDHEVLGAEDGRANFLAPVEKVGGNRAQASLERLRLLNPMVEVAADASNIVEKAEEFFKDFDLVVMTGQLKDEIILVNAMCRKAHIKFYAGDVFGFFGYSFMDLVDHEFVEETKVRATADIDAEIDASGDEPEAKKAKVEEEETKMVKKQMKFTSLEDSLKVDWSEEGYRMRLKRMDPSFFLLHVLYEFQSREGRSPCFSSMTSDLKLLEELRVSVQEKFGLPDAKIPEGIVPLLFSELSPVAAIVGGVLAQEIINAIAGRDAPNKNFFLYNPLESAGIVETVG